MATIARMGILEDALGIDPDDELYTQADELLVSDEGLMRDLVEIRKDRHLTQASVGKIIGVSQATVAEFERSGNDPRLSTVRRYALAVGAQVHHFVIPHKPSSVSLWAQSKVAKRSHLDNEYFQSAVTSQARSKTHG